MRYRLRTLLIVFLAICLVVADNANAQPVFTTEHDWTMRIGGWTYGISQSSSNGAWRSTTIYLGRVAFHSKLTAVQLLGIGTGALAFLLVAAVGLAKRHRQLFRFTIRDVLWLTVVLALGVAWRGS